MELPAFLIAIIVIALLFDFINGFHDSANTIATVISTKVMSPLKAMLWAGLWNFAAFFIAAYILGEFKVGNTIAGIIFKDFITLRVIFIGVIAALIWNIITWWLEIPSSSTHTLIGGLLGSALMSTFLKDYHHLSLPAGINWFQHISLTFENLFAQNVVRFGVVIPIFLFIFFAPFIGIIISVIIKLIIINLSKKANPNKADRTFKKLQYVSSGLFSLGFGLNDAQKAMGIIGAAVICYHVKIIHDPAYLSLPDADQFHFFAQNHLWVPVASFIAIGLGTMSGGWKIIRTMGTKITKVTSLEGLSAETAGALTLFLTSSLGIPVSTTHTTTGAIVGVGLTKRASAVRWGLTLNLFWAWILTIPLSALMGGVIYLIINFLFW